MSQPRSYTVRVLFRFIGAEQDSCEVVYVTARDQGEAQSMARMLWIDSHPPGQGAQYLGSVAELDDGQLSFL